MLRLYISTIFISDKIIYVKMKRFLNFLVIIIILYLIVGCSLSDKTIDNNKIGNDKLKMNPDYKKATFAGGCFWCMEAAFEGIDGIVDVISGYTGGSKENPTYQEVSTGKTGHYEVIEVTFDPNKISYDELLDIFWKNIDPVDDKGQFVDKGSQYKTAIFYVDDEQKKLAEKSKKNLMDSGKFDKPIVTKILSLDIFYPAEEYHQDYYKKRTIQYQIYESGSGRKERLKEVWE
jgi:methionine-S-sulfoxide reductase